MQQKENHNINIKEYKHVKYSHTFLYITVDKTEVFCEILIQRPLARDTLHLPSMLTEKELEHMRQKAANHFDIIMQCLKEMPRQLLLIIRYLIMLINAFCSLLILLISSD